MTVTMDILMVALYFAADVALLALLTFGEFEEQMVHGLVSAGLKSKTLRMVAGLPSGVVRYEPNRPGFAAYVALLAVLSLGAVMLGWAAA